MTSKFFVSPQIITYHVRVALDEDIGRQDLTADLISTNTQSVASIVTRDKATLCGQYWVNEVFRQIEPAITIQWLFSDGCTVNAGDEICKIKGLARTLLTGERTALNFLQIMSAIATNAQYYANEVKGLDVQILDTRKTVPGLRTAQRYAVRCGGCYNHRAGLYDGILIKDNHINAAGSIAKVVEQARRLHPSVGIEVEVENFDELYQSLEANVDIIMLDNFNIADLVKSVSINNGKSKLEASGGITVGNIREIAKTGVDRISVGALTKNIQSIDLSMQFIASQSYLLGK